ncbi:cysteine-rich receptor-like protein kinase 10 [Pistacia vera]|uniref:cysteine-rich receptor-like protein kinase 10 n=1 Tax=Pistacia vera TaxID=55513 RepID=UPI001262E132|nr:cysteine-rich receptor-like protein kinase 10 [Pistacia vera]
MRPAVIPTNDANSLQIYALLNGPKVQYQVYCHFLDVEVKEGNQSREMNIFANESSEDKWWLSLIIVGAALLVPLFCYLCCYDGEYARQKFQTIAAATNNFSTTNVLGKGGFGAVYKGILLDGQEIAIKRLSKSSNQGVEEFQNEAKLIAKLQHTNLVRLLGCSLQAEERILIYEYMPNKSLDFFIFDSHRKKLLNWKTRFNIIEGIAQGLIYLHKYSRLRVIHRDLKASNILLDDQMNPKISDFGMARIFGVNESIANTNRIVGTYGYMSPEYAMNGIVSIKTDVYSFGVLVLEIVSGKKNSGCYHTEHPLNLVGYAWQLWNEGKGLELMDPTMDESCSPDEALRCLHVGLLCVQDQAIERPTMPKVISMLTNEAIPLPAPKQPAFYINDTTEES